MNTKHDQIEKIHRSVNLPAKYWELIDEKLVGQMKIKDRSGKEISIPRESGVSGVLREIVRLYFIKTGLIEEELPKKKFEVDPKKERMIVYT